METLCNFTAVNFLSCCSSSSKLFQFFSTHRNIHLKSLNKKGANPTNFLLYCKYVIFLPRITVAFAFLRINKILPCTNITSEYKLRSQLRDRHV